jgi:hypothetical protein
MLDTQNYLQLVRRRGEAGLGLSRVYRNMRRKELFLLAYSNLYDFDNRILTHLRGFR